jgi:hypothetical protein
MSGRNIWIVNNFNGDMQLLFFCITSKKFEDFDFRMLKE